MRKVEKQRQETLLEEKAAVVTYPLEVHTWTSRGSVDGLRAH